MIEFRKTGSLFDAGTQVIVNTVNCKGVMGKGIALEFKKLYPDMFKEYAKLCKKNCLRPGKIWVWQEQTMSNLVGMACYVFNFPTKDDWRNSSKLEWISAGLDDLKSHVIMMEIESIAMPALGCANGGLCFTDVRALVEEKLNDLQIPVILYEPQ